MATPADKITTSTVEFLNNKIQAKIFVPQKGTYIATFPSTKNFFGGTHFSNLLEKEFDKSILSGLYPMEFAFKKINASLYLSDYEMMVNLSLVLDKDEERKRIGNRIKELRQKRGLTARKLGEMSGISSCNISRVESGLYSIGFDMLTKIANALGCHVDLIEPDITDSPAKKSNG